MSRRTGWALQGMALTRRSLLGGTAAVAAAGLTAGCRGFSRPGGDRDPDRLTFQTWGSDAEAAAFAGLARAFEQQHRGVTVDLQVVPYSEMFTGIDAGLLAGTAPDVFRVDYTTLGLYSSTGQLLDLDGALTSATLDDLLPALRTAVTYEDRVFGAPHQTDTTAIAYRPDLLEAAGVRTVPDRLEDAWTWEEFADVSRRLVGSLDRGVYPFAYDWQAAGAYRWLSWLFMADGRLLDDDLGAPAIVGAPGRRALEFTRSFFEEGWTPANTSTKGALYPDSVFISNTIAMGFVGNFLIPSMSDSIGRAFEWRVTYQPRDRRASTDLGGNALVATEQARNPDLAAAFLAFMVEPGSMATFCAQAVELPTRRSLLEQRLEFASRPDLMPVFTEQATTLSDDDVAQVTNPYFAQMNIVLQNELEECFTGGKSVDDTLTAIADGVDVALGG